MLTDNEIETIYLRGFDDHREGDETPFFGHFLSGFRACEAADLASSSAASIRAQQEALAWAVVRWQAEVANRPMVNVNRRPLDDAWRQVIRHFGGDPDALVGPSHDELRSRITTDEWARMNSAPAPVLPTAVDRLRARQVMTDAGIEALFKKSGGKWDGDRWAIEDADLHPFARAIAAASSSAAQDDAERLRGLLRELAACNAADPARKHPASSPSKGRWLSVMASSDLWGRVLAANRAQGEPDQSQERPR